MSMAQGLPSRLPSASQVDRFFDLGDRFGITLGSLLDHGRHTKIRKRMPSFIPGFEQSIDVGFGLGQVSLYSCIRLRKTSWRGNIALVLRLSGPAYSPGPSDAGRCRPLFAERFGIELLLFLTQSVEHLGDHVVFVLALGQHAHADECRPTTPAQRLSVTPWCQSNTSAKKQSR